MPFHNTSSYKNNSSRPTKTLVKQKDDLWKFNGITPNLDWKILRDETLLTENTRYISLPEDTPKQGSDEWKSMRRMITASKLPSILDFFGKVTGRALGTNEKMLRDIDIKNMYNELRCYFLGDFDYKEDANKDAKIYMEWGTKHKKIALLDFLNKFPEFAVRETLFNSKVFVAGGEINDNSCYLVGASPDGIIVSNEKEAKALALLEIKCPTCFFPFDVL